MRLGHASGRWHHGRFGAPRGDAHPEGRQVSYDALVIGAGANGLVTAHYLARAGKHVLVVEQRHAADPSADIGWVPDAVIRDLGLARAGLRIEEPEPWITAPLDAGGEGALELSRGLRPAP